MRKRHTYQVAILIRTYSVEILYALGAVDEQNTVQVVDLVVNDHSVKAFEDAIKRLSPFVQAGHSQVVGPHRFSVKAGKAEATIKVSPLIPCFYDLGVDPRNRGVGPDPGLVAAAQT